jgi:hypothetical protein
VLQQFVTAVQWLIKHIVHLLGTAHTIQIYNSQRTVNVGDSAMKQKLVDEARRRIVVPYREVSCCMLHLWSIMPNVLHTVALLLRQCAGTQVLPQQLRAFIMLLKACTAISVAASATISCVAL